MAQGAKKREVVLLGGCTTARKDEGMLCCDEPLTFPVRRVVELLGRCNMAVVHCTGMQCIEGHRMLRPRTKSRVSHSVSEALQLGSIQMSEA
jgi:hypothetical protein